MDINTALEEMRQWVREMDRRTTAGEQVTLDEFVEVLEQFEAIDGWLSSGGFLPEAWSVNR